MGSTLSADVTIKSWNSKIVGKSCAAGLRAAFEKFGEDVLKQARHNVSPGVGPSSHPHTSYHVDTGTLMNSLTKTVEDGAQGPVLVIASDCIYSIFLELGWHAHGTGKFYRYPYLMPALYAQAPRINLYLAQIKI